MSTVADAKTTALWLDQLDTRAPRPALDGDREVDVAIVGGGFSGLWTAYYLSEMDPSIRMAVIEKDHCGFGASGRNGGWCVGELAGSFEKYARRSSAEESMRLSRALFDAVDEVGRVIAAEKSTVVSPREAPSVSPAMAPRPDDNKRRSLTCGGSVSPRTSYACSLLTRHAVTSVRPTSGRASSSLLQPRSNRRDW